MKRVIHTIWGGFLFGGFFLLLFPFFLLLLIKDDWKKQAYLLNKLWAKLFLNGTFISYKITYHFKPEKKQRYIYCSNHFSYLDIPTIGLIMNRPFAFIGKSSIGKVPVFGFMYKHFHILVNRHHVKNKYESLVKSMEWIDKGYSLVIFPEGGINSSNPPQMASFKDGAFRAAIEKQIPIIPVTIADNWVILPDKKEFLLTQKKSRVIVHPPIYTSGLTMNDVDNLKETTFEIINKELQKLNNNYKQ